MRKFTNSQVAAIAVLIMMLAFVIAVAWSRAHGMSISPVYSTAAEFCGGVILILCRSIVPQFAGLVEPYLEPTSAPTAEESVAEQKVAAIIAAQVPPAVAESVRKAVPVSVLDAVTRSVNSAMTTTILPATENSKASLTAHADMLKEQISNTPVHVTTEMNVSKILEAHAAMDAQKAADAASVAQNATNAPATAPEIAPIAADGFPSVGSAIRDPENLPGATAVPSQAVPTVQPAQEAANAAANP